MGMQSRMRTLVGLCCCTLSMTACNTYNGYVYLCDCIPIFFRDIFTNLRITISTTSVNRGLNHFFTHAYATNQSRKAGVNTLQTALQLHCINTRRAWFQKKQNQGKHNQSINSNCMVHKKKWQTHMYKKKIKQWRSQRGAHGVQAPQYHRQGISIRLNCTKCVNVVSWFSRQ